jgi:hypothetical protein
MDQPTTYTVFAGQRLVFTGDLRATLARTKEHIDGADDARVLIFDDESGRQVEFDLSGSLDEILAREDPAPRAGPGRPRLGVVSREVSLLPRHWDWLERQPSGISAALRRLVEEASKREPDKQRARLARDATGRVMTALAGDLPGFEEASRALYADDGERFRRLVRKWPADIRAHLLRLSESAFASGSPE